MPTVRRPLVLVAAYTPLLTIMAMARAAIR
jgi:hypothetical protein